MQLLLLLNTGLVITGGLIKRFLVDKSSTVGPVEDFWNDIFDVSPANVATCLPLVGLLDSALPHCKAKRSASASLRRHWMSDSTGCSHLTGSLMGEMMLKFPCMQVLIVWFGEFPEVPKGVPAQTFSIFAAITGLAAFAIVLALVEQLVLEILTQNVSRGSQVYEKGHILVLAWAWTQRDREVIWKILSQVNPPFSAFTLHSSYLQSWPTSL